MASTRRLRCPLGSTGPCISAPCSQPVAVGLALFVVLLLLHAPTGAAIGLPGLRDMNGTQTVVLACADNTECYACASALGLFNAEFSLSATTLSNARSTEAVFFHTLLTNPSCGPDRAPPAMLSGVLELLVGFGDMLAGPIISQKFLPYICEVELYDCFLNATCRSCLAGVLAPGAAAADSLTTPACIATGTAWLDQIVSSRCVVFPICSYVKDRCNVTPGCMQAVDALRRGDGVTAARLSPVGTPAYSVVNVVAESCLGVSQLSCDFWFHRCHGHANCTQCMSAMGWATSVPVIVKGSQTDACQRLVHDSDQFKTLLFMAAKCPRNNVSSCATNAVMCVLSAVGPRCAQCLGAPTAPSHDGNTLNVEYPCHEILDDSGVSSVCAACSTSIALINHVVIATAAVGGFSVLCCAIVLLQIFAYSKDRKSMRDRIVAGLMLANAIYSSANAIPTALLSTSEIDCGNLVLSFSTIRFGRAWWFCGKYALVAFEIFILGASSWTLSRGACAMSPLWETVFHIGCMLCGIAAFLVFYIECLGINAAGYNEATLAETQDDGFEYLSDHDDLDDDSPRLVAANAFVAARNRYDTLVQRMLQIWVAFLGLAILLWFYLRKSYFKIVGQWRRLAEKALLEEADDEWKVTRRSRWQTQRRVLAAQRGVYAQVARPLELYVLIFVLFGAPAIVMATDFCLSDSGAQSTGHTSIARDGSLSYRTCDVWCEFALSFRSLAAVAVYFWPRQHRAELWDVQTMFRNLWMRVLSWCSSRRSGSANVSGATPTVMELFAMSAMSADDGDSWQINEENIRLDKKLAEGSYGAVWEGHCKGFGAVAIKVLFAKSFDDDGDLCNEQAAEDLRKECAVLERLDHPNLLKFYGFGTTVDGNGFVVTELLGRGSLRDALDDEHTRLDWSTVSTIALHVALGMDCLHSIPVIHRDLKSANILLDEHLNAKVCDFGASRQLHSQRPEVLYSSFTGVTHIVRGSTSLTIDPHEAACIHTTLANLAVGVVDAHGTMTAAVGSLLWMAPEVLRGDKEYGTEVDVFAFGMVLWELATRERPWDELGGHHDFFDLIRLVTKALQKGRRPTLPSTVATEAPDFVSLMRKCWAGDPADRPSFPEVAKHLAVLTHDNGPNIRNVQCLSGRNARPPRRDGGSADLTERLLSADNW